MIQSMTGYGKVTTELPAKKVTIEIKTLNSKQLDVSTRIPSIFKEKDMEIRSKLLRTLQRGKVDFSIYIEFLGKETLAQINAEAVETYYNQIRDLAKRMNISEPQDWMQTLLRLPDSVKTVMQEIDEDEWKVIDKGIDEAINQVISFRMQEGEMLRKLLAEKIGNISRLLTEVETYEVERIDKIKTRILESLQKLNGVEYDQNRFEQEMIYYIERLDINEEKNRLANHLKYFIETLDMPEGQGKKLGFISQEIGREVNTLGSKSNHVEMQKIVVQMKDELEQIKEQILNIL